MVGDFQQLKKLCPFQNMRSHWGTVFKCIRYVLSFSELILNFILCGCLIPTSLNLKPGYTTGFIQPNTNGPEVKSKQKKWTIQYLIEPNMTPLEMDLTLNSNKMAQLPSLFKSLATVNSNFPSCHVTFFFNLPHSNLLEAPK